MMFNSLNFLTNSFNLILILVYLVLLNIEHLFDNIEYFIIITLILNLFFKFFSWYKYKILIKKNISYLLKKYFFNVNFAKINIIIFSIVLPIYMILQKNNLVIDTLVEKISFFIVFIFTLIGFFVEFYILESEKNEN